MGKKKDEPVMILQGVKVYLPTNKYYAKLVEIGFILLCALVLGIIAIGLKVFL